MENNANSENPSLKKSDKPWRNISGEIKGDSELRAMATEWSASTWEAYLADVEMGQNVESSPDDETLFGYPSQEDIFSTENYLKNFIAELKVEAFPKFGTALRKAMSTLSKRQHKIIVLIFWEGLNIQEVAVELGISKQSVFVHLGRAVPKIRSTILNELTENQTHLATARLTGGCLTFPKAKSGNPMA